MLTEYQMNIILRNLLSNKWGLLTELVFFLPKQMKHSINGTQILQSRQTWVFIFNTCINFDNITLTLFSLRMTWLICCFHVNLLLIWIPKYLPECDSWTLFPFSLISKSQEAVHLILPPHSFSIQVKSGACYTAG